MKKYILMIILALAGFSQLGAQQTIQFIDGSELKVKITEIADKTVSFHKMDNLDGPLYVRDKKNIVKIIYEDGHEDILGSYQKIINDDTYKPNMLNFHLLDIAYEDFTFSYERFFAKGNFSFQIPFGFGYQSSTSQYNYKDNSFYSGFSLFYYPFGQKKWTYFFGPEFRFGYLHDTYLDYFYDQNGNYFEDEVEIRSNYFKMFIRNGVMFSPINSLSISANFGLGIKNYFVDNIFKTEPHGAINVGYRF